jgi:hypothetical protein
MTVFPSSRRLGGIFFRSVMLSRCCKSQVYYVCTENDHYYMCYHCDCPTQPILLIEGTTHDTRSQTQVANPTC